MYIYKEINDITGSYTARCVVMNKFQKDGY